MNRHLLLLVAVLSACPIPPATAMDKLWEKQLDGEIAGAPIQFHDSLLVGAGQTLLRIEENGEKRWRKPLAAITRAALAADDEHIYVHTEQGLVAFDANGDRVWTYAAEDAGPQVDGRYWGWGEGLFTDAWAWYRSAPVIDSGSIIFGNSAGLHAVNANTGELQWHATMGAVTGTPVVTGGGIIVGSWDNFIYKLDRASGEVIWTTEALLPRGPYPGWAGWNGFHVSPVVYENTVIAGTRGTYLYGLDLETGTEKWSIKAGTSWLGSAAVVSNGTAYAGLSDGQAVIGVNLAGGNQSFFLPTPGLVFATPLVHGYKLIVGTLFGELLVFDLSQSSLLHQIKIHDNERSYRDYLAQTPDEDDLSAYDRSVSSLKTMKGELHSILSMTIVDDQLLVGTASGRLIAYALP
ncbi:MAG: hypothetical protein DHS20C11_37000 [Lysobacteraceae bacterium]|nr:MAG: hypothetical protein DHS20C11_37000 [Xanthomonadaceae bacterium]